MIRLFKVFVPSSVIALALSELLLIYSCYLLATFIVFTKDDQPFMASDLVSLPIVLVVLSIMVGLYFHDLYSLFRVKSRALLLQQTAVVVGLAFLAQALLGYLRLHDLLLPARIMMYGSAMVFVVLPSWRIFYSSVVLKAMGSEGVLFLGTASISREIGRHLAEHPENGFKVLGYVDSANLNGAEPSCGKYLGPISDLRQIVDGLRPLRIVVGMSDRRERLPVNQLLDMRLSGIPIEDAMTTYEAMFGRISARELRPSQLVFSNEIGPNRGRVLLQSIYSMTIAVVAAVLASPIILIVALLVKLSSAGPVLFRQQRVGKNDAVFTLYKFRSMYRDAEAASGAVWAQEDDPRVTPVGRWLRKLHLDELPQLFNVLKGDMSIVGPRPERPEFVTQLAQRIPYYRQRHCIKPGITGWAQINQKYSDSIEDTLTKLEYDLYYIKNLDPALDVVIMFHTMKVMLLSRGSR